MRTKLQMKKLGELSSDLRRLACRREARQAQWQPCTLYRIFHRLFYVRSISSRMRCEVMGCWTREQASKEPGQAQRSCRIFSCPPGSSCPAQAQAPRSGYSSNVSFAGFFHASTTLCRLRECLNVPHVPHALHLDGPAAAAILALLHLDCAALAIGK
jgi:hypothetical protein